MSRSILRRSAGVAGLAVVLSTAALVAPAGAASLSGSSSFKMISGLSRVRNCVVGDLNSNAKASWTLNKTSGLVTVNFNSTAKDTCLSLYQPGSSNAQASLSYQSSTGTVLASRTVLCNDTKIALPTHCPLPATTTFSNVALNKVVITLTQTSPAAPPSTTTVTVPPSINESDSFKMLSGLSRIRNCQLADLESQAHVDWTYRSTGQNSIAMSGAGRVCMSLFRPLNSTAKAVVSYKNAAGAVLTTRTVNCVDTARVLAIHCPFPASTDLTLVGLTQVTIDFTQTSPSAGTSSTTLLLGD